MVWCVWCKATGVVRSDPVVMPTFGIDPVRIQIGQGRLVAELLNGFERLVVDLEDATRSPPPAILVGHVLV